jgi:ornithine cyclodeaminase/alanine dehydrogenase-like protein (mu-crystallin family)/gentisate 1,2-dioxygenase
VSKSEFLWISEADVVEMMDIGDAIRAVESGLAAEARGEASNMDKTHVSWDGGTLHAIGAKLPGIAGTKTWAYTTGGATPLLIVYDSANGAIKAIIESRVLGQIRTGAISGVATRALAAPDADEMAIIGTGRQALPQVAAVAAVRPLRGVRVWGRTREHAREVAAGIEKELEIRAEVSPSVAAAVKGARIITTATRSREPFLTADMVAPGTHINAIGAIIPTGSELSSDLVKRCDPIFADSISQARKLARELIDAFDESAWKRVRPLSDLFGGAPPRSPAHITLLKSLGIGIADLAIGSELLRIARERGLGRLMPHPRRAEPRLRAGSQSGPKKSYAFVDRSGAPEPKHHPATPVVITREEIDAEIARLAALPRPQNGRRMSQIVNPAAGVGSGLAPGTGVSLSVLAPGERTRPVRENASLVNFCIRGRGTSIVDGKRIRFGQYDVWNTPPWAVYEHVNDTDELQVRLTYSNAPLLEKLNVHVVEEEPRVDSNLRTDNCELRTEHPFGTLQLTDDGAFLMPYEKLIHPDVVPMEALHWPWELVKEQLDKLTALGSSYGGRRLYLLFNPATGRTNGTSHTFFATMCVRPANIVDRPHRHTASAINYFFKGSGSSVIEGKRYTWRAGDLMLTAPGWAIHNHSSHDDDVYELTIQDSPVQIAMGSLLWQEDLEKPPEILGTTGGFATNREKQEVGR